MEHSTLNNLIYDFTKKWSFDVQINLTRASSPVPSPAPAAAKMEHRWMNFGVWRRGERPHSLQKASNPHNIHLISSGRSSPSTSQCEIISIFGEFILCDIKQRWYLLESPNKMQLVDTSRAERTHRFEITIIIIVRPFKNNLVKLHYTSKQKDEMCEHWTAPNRERERFMKCKWLHPFPAVLPQRCTRPTQRGTISAWKEKQCTCANQRNSDAMR